ncbi:LamG-like jellyroll fold domain-containing protein [Salinimicrobium xinjiangense]|uniref:LamG-like jellyroll fold domain-containing protein n=1 Tax=Salinimicrobium xinjiangense TaxID=438596 RepID=UPI00041EB099|nr:LamG-like jellyroll fold domain-containing protein [Salinimicrobium xinjiangense]
MKNYNRKFLGFLAFLFILAGCEREGIDPITEVDPGPDQGAPVVNINFPREGTSLKTVEEVSTIDINFDVTDDIEIAQIEVLVNGEVIETFSEFTDYRIVEREVTFSNVTSGEHTVTVRATDLDGNQTTQTVNFSKEPPYSPRFENEVFYMPFDGDFMELVGLRSPGVVGNPGFADEAFAGSGAFAGAPDSYLTIPIESLGEDFTAAFWYKVSGDPNRAGILVAGADQNRTQGFRLFREGSADEQRIKLNVGTGAGESWNDGGVIDVNAGEWVHVAFTVSPTQTVIYINGMPVNTGAMASPIDWTGVEELTIGHGGETFSYWDHLYDSSAMDELRLFDSAMTQEEIQNLINASSVTLHMTFEGDFTDQIANRSITTVGNPDFSDDSQQGDSSYEGAAGSYLTTPSDGLLSSEFSATFWYKVNADPNRAGIIVVGPEDAANPDAQNVRTSGFRLFREGSATEQRIKLNVGTGGGESWNDGGVVDAVAGEWVHVAFTISTTETKIYLNGDLANTGSLSAPIDWTGTDLVSIMSGAPRFTGWNHLADHSLMDDLKFYNKALTEEEIEADMAN